MANLDESLQRVSLRDQLTQRLERMILAGEIPPGDTLLSEREMMERWEISRTVVRDAIRTLESRGLGEGRHGVGAVVTSDVHAALVKMLDLLIERGGYRLSELVTLRMALEDAACKLATQFATKEDLKAMNRLLRANVQAMRDGDLARAEELHRQFHLRLIESTHNQPFVDLIAPLYHHFLAKTLESIMRLSLRERHERHTTHWEALERMKAGDAEGAARYLQEDLAVVLEDLRRLESTADQEALGEAHIELKETPQISHESHEQR